VTRCACPRPNCLPLPCWQSMKAVSCRN